MPRFNEVSPETIIHCLIDPDQRIPQVFSFREICAMLDREVRRARRNRSALSLVVFSLGKTDDGYTFAALVFWKLLGKRERNEGIGWFDERHIGVIMPGVSGKDAMRFAEEVREDIPVKVRLQYRLFHYPDMWLDDYREYDGGDGVAHERRSHSPLFTRIRFRNFTGPRRA